jgi:predicted secreted protein
MRHAPGNRRHALLSNCLANQNAKVDEYALCPGVVTPFLDLLRRADYHIQQMPCPEMTFLGANRWWQVREQYDTPGYRAHCRNLAESVAQILSFQIKDGCDDLILIGVEGSGSSAVAITGVGALWGGRPEDIAWQQAEGKGVWIEELEAILAKYDLPVPRAYGFPGELPDFDMDAALAKFAAFLAAKDNAHAPERQ